jgi:hypothetical protein
MQSLLSDPCSCIVSKWLVLCRAALRQVHHNVHKISDVVSGTVAIFTGKDTKTTACEHSLR